MRFINYDEVVLLCEGIGVQPDPMEEMAWSMSAPVHPSETDETDSIAFDHVSLPDGRYILMSSYDFASSHDCGMYQAVVVTQDEVVGMAETLIDNARSLLGEREEAVAFDNADTWIPALRQYAHLPAPATRTPHKEA
jgi:hypothetical protein